MQNRLIERENEKAIFMSKGLFLAKIDFFEKFSMTQVGVAEL
jgi:hypothetical protein